MCFECRVWNLFSCLQVSSVRNPFGQLLEKLKPSVVWKSLDMCRQPSVFDCYLRKNDINIKSFHPIILVVIRIILKIINDIIPCKRNQSRMLSSLIQIRSLEFERHVGIHYKLIVQSVWWCANGSYLAVKSGPWTNSEHPRLYLQFANVYYYWKVFATTFIVHIDFLG